MIKSSNTRNLLLCVSYKASMGKKKENQTVYRKDERKVNSILDPKTYEKEEHSSTIYPCILGF